jgi:hypothetical protein
VQNNLLTNIADAENFAVCDFIQGFSSIWVNQAAVAHKSYLRYFFLEAAALCQIVTRYATPVHAACVELEGSGILLCGDSGVGKSTLAYALSRTGWTYVTDDAAFLVLGREGRQVVGNCHQFRFRPSAVEFFPELRGMEVTQRAEVGKPSIELVTYPARQITRSFTSSIDHIVFLSRRDVSRQELVPFSRKVARYFMLQPLFSMPDMLKSQAAAIDKLLEGELFELRYSSLEWAIDRLGRLVREGRCVTFR